MTPIQQLMLGVGAKKKTYLDDVFSTYLYTGNTAGSGSQAINNGINLSGEGGMTWVKRRDGSASHWLMDTVRGGTKMLATNANGAETTASGAITSFNNNGFTLGAETQVNYSGTTYSSWSFRKAPGFFDVVTYTGNAAGRWIPHNLGCIPGMILIKRYDDPENWVLYHRGPGATHYLRIDNMGTDPAYANSGFFLDTEPTATQFRLGTQTGVNGPGYEFVAYLFAGGESTAATARSVDFSGSSDEIFENSTGSVLRNWFDQAFTVEYWVKADALASGDGGGSNAVGVSTLGTSNLSWSFGPNNTGQIRFSYWNGSAESTILPSETIKVGQWYHLAFVHDGSNNCKIFINGTLGKEATISNGTANAGDMVIGQVQSTQFNGKVSNLRITHQALYTTSFRPPTEPLTTTSQGATASNVKLLCCNNSSVTGSTVSPSGMGNNGSPTASTDSPFDDPAAFTFGENEDQGIIKCGSYVGSGTAGLKVDLGFEPQFILHKKTSGTASDWAMFDSMRGIVDAGLDAQLAPNTNGAEGFFDDQIDLTPTGFQVESTSHKFNTSGTNYIYMAIRRPDGYVGKPPELGTGVFAMDTGSGSAGMPSFDSGFPVDWVLTRQPASTQEFHSIARLTGTNYMFTNSTAAETAYANFTMDSNLGWSKGSESSSNQSWMWKRHAGFDVVTYKGNMIAGHQIPHSLNKIPEMMWVKRRSNTGDWWIYHKDLDGGNQPETHYVRLNTQDQEGDSNNVWNDTAPTSTHFTVGAYNLLNGDGDDLMAMLFASVDGISKIGSYDGSYSSKTITTGFQPRFVWIRVMNSNGPFVVLDTTRGWGSGNDNYLDMSSTAAQVSADLGAPTSTGFTLPGNVQSVNTGALNRTYMYYAHA